MSKLFRDSILKKVVFFWVIFLHIYTAPRLHMQHALLNKHSDREGDIRFCKCIRPCYQNDRGYVYRQQTRLEKFSRMRNVGIGLGVREGEVCNNRFRRQ